jgi:hypothetical protein
MQYNLGFYAGDTPEDDLARIGIGIRFHERSDCLAQTWEDYYRFQQAVAAHPAQFAQAFTFLPRSVYVEPEWLMDGYPSLAAAIQADTLPELATDGKAWRFFGVALYASDSTDVALLDDIDQFAAYAKSIFDQIHGFPLGI